MILSSGSASPTMAWQRGCPAIRTAGAANPLLRATWLLNVTIETYSSDFPGLISGGPTEFALVAAAHSVPRFDYYGSNGPNSQLTLHPDYLIGRPDGCEICVASWAEFTPYAGPADVHRLMQFDLSCLTRWHPCVTQSDIMPAAWAQYLSDAARLDEEWPNLACSPVMLGLVGRDSTNIVTGKILAYQLVDVSEGYYQGLAKVRIQVHHFISILRIVPRPFRQSSAVRISCLCKIRPVVSHLLR